MNRRIVFDTSVLISAALRIGSTSHQALSQAFATCDVCVSPDTLDELDRVLSRDKFDRYLDRRTRREFAMMVRRHAHVVSVSAAVLAAVNPPCRDSKDDQFLALLQVSDANALISSDEDLLVLNPWNGIAILTPKAFLDSSGPR